jgi:hypothetical protein
MSEKFVQILKKYDESLDKAHIQEYSLSTQLSPGGFSFAIFHSGLNKYLSLESVEWDYTTHPSELVKLLEAYFNGHEWLNFNYPVVLLYYEPLHTTLVPSPLFDQSQKEQIARFNFNVPDNHLIMSDKLKTLDAYLLYSVPELIMRKLLDLLPEYKITSHTGNFIELLLTRNKNLPAEKLMFVNIRSGMFDIVITEGKRLLFHNAFSYNSREDVIYYMIFVMEQLAINPEETEVFLSGIIDRDSKLFEIMYKYVRHISFLKLSDQFNYSYHYSDIPEHYFYNLINSRLCEL